MGSGKFQSLSPHARWRNSAACFVAAQPEVFQTVAVGDLPTPGDPVPRAHLVPTKYDQHFHRPGFQSHRYIGKGNQAMKYRSFSACCECGRRANRIKDIGFTASHELVVHWWCSECKRAVYVVKSLSDCWRYCPEREGFAHVQQTGRAAFGPEDTRFLRSLGVTLLADR